MNTRLQTNRLRRRRAGFTLVELLAVITVMAILAGILVPVIFSALTTAEEFTITTEVQQLDAAVEQFKTDYGFYPPAIGSGPGYEVNSAIAMRRYLNRISPNHNEGNGLPGTRLGIWWDNVGQYMDDRSSLVFWLSGLAKNKQFPLSGYAANTAQALKPYKIDELHDGTPLAAIVERDVYYEFEPGRLQELSGFPVAGYRQPAGDEAGDLFYRYRDYRSYQDDSTSPVTPLAYFAGTNTAGLPNYINPERFQIACPGMDGLPGGIGTLNLFDQTASPGLVERDDNITNFANGRIEKFINENQ